MFKVNDFVVYGSLGVFRITDIETGVSFNSAGNERYLILHPAKNDNIIVKIPVNKQELLLRPIITKEEALALIAAMPAKEHYEIQGDKQRNYIFKSALKTGKNEERIKVIKTLYLDKQEKLANNRKVTKTAEDFMNAAETQLYEEFSLALNISPAEVLPFILEKIQEVNV